MSRILPAVCLLGVVVMPGSLVALAGESAPPSVTLKDGTHVEVVAAGRAVFANGDNAITIRYKTALPMSKPTELESEAELVWSALEVQVGSTGIDAIVVRADETSTGSISRSYTTVLRRSDGKWRAQHPTPHP